MIRKVALLAVFLGGLVPAAARAGTLVDILDFSVGAKGGAGGDVWLQANSTPNTPYFDKTRGGWDYGAGIFAELRVLKYLGFEFDLLFFHDVLKESTDVTTNGYTVTSEERVEWTAVRMPLLLKAVLPVGIARLSLGTGPEFSVGIDSTGKSVAKKGASFSTRIPTRTVTDYYWVVGLGATFSVASFLAITLDLRFDWNITQPSTWQARTGFDRSTFDFRSSNSLDAKLLLGVAYEF